MAPDRGGYADAAEDEAGSTADTGSSSLTDAEPVDAILLDGAADAGVEVDDGGELDGAADAGADGGLDADADGGLDAEADGGLDAAADGGFDAGADAGLDADGGPDGGSRTALDFPSNNGTGSPASGDATMFYFPDPQNDGLPIWGPNGEGVTYLWEVRPRQQTGYYTTFFWSNNGSFLWRSGAPDAYYGAHPYPTSSSNQGTSHNWEISVGGGDVVTTRSGGPHLVIKDRWYRQGLRVIREGNGTKRLIYYLDLPSVADGDVIETVESANYGEVLPPSPALVFGNAPWRLSFQDERLSGALRGLKIFNVALSEAELLAESAAPGLVTATGQARIWYGKINPTPSDLLCDFGTGRAPLWIDSGRPTLEVE